MASREVEDGRGRRKLSVYIGADLYRRLWIEKAVTGDDVSEIAEEAFVRALEVREQGRRLQTA